MTEITVDTRIDCATCGEFVGWGEDGGYGPEGNLCWRCNNKRERDESDARRQTAWEQSAHRDVSLLGQIIFQSVYEVDSACSDERVGQIRERHVLIDVDGNQPGVVAIFTRAVGITLRAVERKKSREMHLDAEAMARLHQAMIAWYADTAQPSGVCAECAVPCTGAFCEKCAELDF